jgi:hypothetical protein
MPTVHCATYAACLLAAQSIKVFVPLSITESRPRPTNYLILKAGIIIMPYQAKDKMLRLLAAFSLTVILRTNSASSLFSPLTRNGSNPTTPTLLRKLSMLFLLESICRGDTINSRALVNALVYSCKADEDGMPP